VEYVLCLQRKKIAQVDKCKTLVPGDYAFDPLGLSNGKSAEWLADMKLKELNNGVARYKLSSCGERIPSGGNVEQFARRR